MCIMMLKTHTHSIEQPDLSNYVVNELREKESPYVCWEP